MLISVEVGGFITLVDQYWVAWLTAILFAALLVVELFLLPETLFPRKLILSRLPTSGSFSNSNDPEKRDTTLVLMEDFPKTKQLPFINFQKVPGIEHPKPWAALVEFLKLWTFPNVAVAVFFYCFAWLA
jgi:hypothetical protein